MTPMFAMAALLAAAPASSPTPSPANPSAIVFEEVRVAGPEGALSALYHDPAPAAPVVILIPGSGPTSRDGTSPMLPGGGKIYEQLAVGLAERGIATLRADKRGMFASAAAITDPNAVRLADYAADAAAFADLLIDRGKPCAWLLGHSEGAIVALLAAQAPDRWCGVISLAGPGRSVGVLLREQLGRQLPAETLAEFDRVIATIEAGGTPDPAPLPPPLAALFTPAVIGFLSDLIRADPAQLAGQSALPLLIVQLGEDLQVADADAATLAAARPDARRVDLDGVNHVLKPVIAGDVADNRAAYLDGARAIDPRIAAVIADFILAER
ncbi:serine aminopeptidase domain-containing protein [Sphingomicrobium astaxanthinifaciens]|uniref:serine aminopeptidase domain-containing protein n=1 Tax=Sphingomicrobium astaxanthinifaciens TaxID=1227949 RepID=UPI001FCB1601|nr:alpha/beta hydrolase [Sphingomicrobium astaxanthinifaciens]MCJ7421095.1 alpha/beta fold hydrolase [Sphingomicrobium astaxanthinifaciens]